MNENHVESIVTLIKSKKGCKFYQKKILNDSNHANNFLYPSLKPFMLKLINHKYGNFLYQQFTEILVWEYLDHLLEFISLHFKEISCSKYGTNVIQKLIENIQFEKPYESFIYDKLFEMIRGNVQEISLNENANHIIQKFIMLIKSPRNDFVFQEIYHSFLSIATTKSGCCVIKKAILFGNSLQKQMINNLILQNIFYLISCKYGNYVVQCIILTSEEYVVSTMYTIISKEIISLCKSKFSSNVIEKFFEIKNKSLINKIANCMLQDESKIIELLLNPFGNYIIQKILLSINDKFLINKIVSVLYKNIETIKELSFGRRIFKFIQNFPNFIYLVDKCKES